MRRLLLALAIALAALVLAAPAALAGSPHFVGTSTLTRTGDTLTASGKLAGLGNEPQVHVVLTATAQCVNPGGNKPAAGNKQTVTAEGDFPVQNGKADWSLSVTAVTSPSCTPPMTLVYSDVTVTAAGLSYTFSGTY